MTVAVRDQCSRAGTAAGQDTNSLGKERTMTERGQRPARSVWDPGPSTMARVRQCQRGVASGDRVHSVWSRFDTHKRSSSAPTESGGRLLTAAHHAGLPVTPRRQYVDAGQEGRTMAGRGQRPAQRVWGPDPLAIGWVGSGGRVDASGDRVPLDRSWIGSHKRSHSAPAPQEGAR